MNYLLDFYGPLLTKHQQEVFALYCDEDLTLAEIAEQLGITRQGASDALKKARTQLEHYESQLGLVERYRLINESAQAGLEALRSPSEEAVQKARECFENILSTARRLSDGI